MEFRIVDVSAEHIRQIEEIERDCFSRPWTAEQLKSQMSDEQHEFIAAVDGSRVFGYVGLMYVLDEGYISNVAVHPDARRQGIGDALIDVLAAKAAELELAFLTLEVRESNAPAIALYAKHGFHPVGKRKNYYDAPKEDAVLMTCYLK